MIKVYIGLPGSGKSTHAAKMARKYRRKGIDVYSNFPVKGTYLIDTNDLGVWNVSNGVVLLDEAGIDFNNRKWKGGGVSQETIKFLKLYRHYHLDIIVYSQAFDFDITIRRLADRMYIIKKGTLLRGLSYTKRLIQYWKVDEQSGEPFIAWRFSILPKWPFWRRRFYRDFDSFDAPALPVKEFKKVVVAADETQSVPASDSPDNN